MATTLDHLAWVLSAEGRLEDAEELAKAALAIREKAKGAEGDELAAACNTLACIYDAEGRLEEARAAFARSAELAEKAHGADHAARGRGL